MSDEHYANIREILHSFIGRCLVEITQHDQEEYAETKQAYITFMFDNGGYIKVPIEEGFIVDEPETGSVPDATGDSTNGICVPDRPTPIWTDNDVADYKERRKDPSFEGTDNH